VSDTVKITVRDENNVDKFIDAPCIGRFGPICVTWRLAPNNGRWYSLTHVETGRRFGPLFGDGLLALECCEAMWRHFPAEFWIPPESGTDLKRKAEAIAFAEPWLAQDAATMLAEAEGW